MAWLFLHPHPTLQLRGCVRFHLESPRGCEPTVSPKLFLPSVSVSVLSHDGWERPQPVLAGTYLPGQTPALQLVRVFALQALRDLSEGIQDGKEMGGGEGGTLLHKLISLARPVFNLPNQCTDRFSGPGATGRSQLPLQ